MSQLLQEIINYNLDLFIQCLETKDNPDEIKSQLDTNLENMDTTFNSLDKTDKSPEIITTIGQIIEDKIKAIPFTDSNYTPLRRSARIKNAPIDATKSKLETIKSKTSKGQVELKGTVLDLELEKKVITILQNKLVLPTSGITNYYGENNQDTLPYFDDTINNIYKTQKYNLTDKNILELYTIVYTGSIKTGIKTIDISSFIDKLIKFLPPTDTRGSITSTDYLGKNRNLFTPSSITTIVKFFHDDYIAVVDDSSVVTRDWELITIKTEKDGILDNIGIKSGPLGQYACVNRDFKNIRIGAGMVEVIKLDSFASKTKHREYYANIDVYRQRCGTCWLCGQDVYVYKLIYKTTPKNKAWFYSRLNCGEDEHCIPPLLGNIIGTLAPTSKETLKADPVAMRMLELGVAPSHITCNQVKKQASFIKFPKKEGDKYTLNDVSIKHFVKDLYLKYKDRTAYTNDPYKYNLEVTPTKFNEAKVIKNIEDHLTKILSIANNTLKDKSVYEITLANTAKLCCDTLDSIMASVTAPGTSTSKKGGGLYDDDDSLKILLCYLLIQASIENPEKEYISGSFNKIFMEIKPKLNLLISGETKDTPIIRPAVKTPSYVTKTESNFLNDMLKSRLFFNVGGKQKNNSKNIHRKSKKLHRKSKKINRKNKKINNKKTHKKYSKHKYSKK
jgi:hypothetical protein